MSDEFNGPDDENGEYGYDDMNVSGVYIRNGSKKSVDVNKMTDEELIDFVFPVGEAGSAGEEAERLIEADEENSRLKNIYDIKAGIRNDLIRFYEKSKFLSNILSGPYLPVVCSAQLRDEDVVLRRGIYCASGGSEEEARLLPGENVAQWSLEEYSKNVADKVCFYFGEGKVAKMKRLMEDAKDLLDDEKDLDFLRKVSVAKLAAIFGEEIKADAGAAAGLLMRVDAVFSLNEKDFGLPVSDVFRLPEVRGSFRSFLADALKIDPDLFAVVRARMSQVGIADESFLTSPEVKGAVLQVLSDALVRHPRVFCATEKKLKEYGLITEDKEQLYKAVEVEYICAKYLYEKMVFSPDLYIFFRDEWANELGLFDADEMDRNPGIQRAYKSFLHMLKCASERLCRKMEYKWRQQIESTDVEISREEEKQVEDSYRVRELLDAKKNVMWIDDPDGGLMESYGGIMEFRCERMKQAEKEMTEIGFITQRTQMLQSIREFFKKYPQFAEEWEKLSEIPLK